MSDWNTLRTDLRIAREALHKIRALKAGQSPIGTLHGLGMDSGFHIAAQIADEALGQQHSIPPAECAPNSGDPR